MKNQKKIKLKAAIIIIIMISLLQMSCKKTESTPPPPPAKPGYIEWVHIANATGYVINWSDNYVGNLTVGVVAPYTLLCSNCTAGTYSFSASLNNNGTTYSWNNDPYVLSLPAAGLKRDYTFYFTVTGTPYNFSQNYNDVSQ